MRSFVRRVGWGDVLPTPYLPPPQLRSYQGRGYRDAIEMEFSRESFHSFTKQTKLLFSLHNTDNPIRRNSAPQMSPRGEKEQNLLKCLGLGSSVLQASAVPCPSAPLYCSCGFSARQQVGYAGHAPVLGLRGLRQEDLCEFEANLS